MSLKINQYKSHIQAVQADSPDPNHTHQRPSHSHQKNAYVGITLMEYFKISSSKAGLEDIDQESNSSISLGTPCFAQHKDHTNKLYGSKMGRRDRLRVQTEQQLLPLSRQDHEQLLPKVAVINLDQAGVFDRNMIRLPSIHYHRHANNSRQDILKDGKIVTKKQSWKSKNEETNNHNPSLNNGQRTRIHELQRHAVAMKKSLRNRVTSTSFYHPRTKERERVKTEQQSIEKYLQKPFIVTKYGGLSIGAKSSKEQTHSQTWKKQENTYKLVKNNNR